jgi:hypothetical protein
LQQALMRVMADFWPVEFPCNTFIGQDGVFAAMRRIALADAGESAVVARDDFVVATALPRARNEIEGLAGLRLEEKGGECLQARAGLAIRVQVLLPNGERRRAAGYRFEGGPKSF